MALSLTSDTDQRPSREATAQLHFPHGLIGYPEWQRFHLDVSPDTEPVAILQSDDEAEVSFLVADPRLVSPGYRVGVQADLGKTLGLENGETPAALCILVLRDDPPSVTANLLGPILYNQRTGVAAQVVLADSDYSPRHPVLLGAMASADESSPLPQGSPCSY